MSSTFPRYIFLLAIVLLCIPTASSQSVTDSLEDQSGNHYSTVQIGSQVWMAENLNAAKFVNGDRIPEVKTAADWEAARDEQTPAWTFYEADSTFGVVYGRLYNRHAIDDLRGLCPTGWEVPSDDDWKALERHLGMSEKSADSTGWRGNVGGHLKSTRSEPSSHPRWVNPNVGATNKSGFSAVPGGYRTGKPNYDEQKEGSYRMIGEEAAFWTANGGGRGLWADRKSVFRGLANLTTGFGFSVRCIKS